MHNGLYFMKIVLHPKREGLCLCAFALGLDFSLFSIYPLFIFNHHFVNHFTNEVISIGFLRIDIGVRVDCLSSKKKMCKMIYYLEGFL